jgi:xanthine dehydrogenase molybdenum-binding subunit
MDYKIPTFSEMPDEQHTFLVESDEPTGPFGAKSVGEIGINTVAAAIGNGIVDAIGTRLHKLPFTSERVLAAMMPQEQA